MHKRLIYFATPQEATATLFRLNARSSPDCPRCHYFEEGLIIVGGVGMLETMHMISKHIHAVQEVWNLGIAGSLHMGRYYLGERVPIASVRPQAFYPVGLEERSQSLHQRLYPLIAIQEQGARLVTADYPIHQDALRDHLAQHADLIDMEGYAIAFLASRWNKPCHMWKVVSDFATVGGPELIRAQLANASEQLADIAITK